MEIHDGKNTKIIDRRAIDWRRYLIAFLLPVPDLSNRPPGSDPEISVEYPAGNYGDRREIPAVTKKPSVMEGFY